MTLLAYIAVCTLVKPQIAEEFCFKSVTISVLIRDYFITDTRPSDGKSPLIGVDVITSTDAL